MKNKKSQQINIFLKLLYNQKILNKFNKILIIMLDIKLIIKALLQKIKIKKLMKN
jgi:hypothetical protein